MIRLDVISGPNKGACFEPEEPSFIIGRGRTNRIILLDSKVSARHAQVGCREERYVLRDLNSTNGTFLNGTAVNQAFLKKDDEIRVGQTVLKVEAVTVKPVGRANKVNISDAGAAAPAPVHSRVGRQDASQILEIPPAETNAPALTDAYRNLLAMYKVSGIIRANVDIDRLLDEVLAQIFRNFQAERGAVMLFDDETGELVPRVFRSHQEAPDEAEMTISRTIVNQVIDNQEAVLTTDATLDKRFDPAESIAQQHIRSAMCAPLSTEDRPLGIIYVDCKTHAGRFSKADLELLTAIANEAGLAVENRMLHNANIKAERLAAVGQTIAGLSHYVKNVLTCMEAGSEIVSRALDDDDVDAVRKGWKIVNRNERKISELVLDMLNYSAERTPAKTTCSLNNLLEDVVQTVKPTAEAAEVDLALKLDPGLPNVEADPNGVNRCLLNLLTNALDAVKGCREPNVIVSTSREGDRAVIRVTDNGPGIPDEMKSKIFDAFVSTKGEQGTGLGLAVVKKIVNEHAGEVSVSSSPPSGAEFKIALPTSPSELPGSA